ncbi:hypothetical protein QQS21_006882 [Conoideocrella luteorostrata]|uniref:Uncharacterized protein n=1 Tax=Conoideocrella luteorostrata TaxID=1105319 RepID=A0AAJ0FXW5_9HYPO|nr:hypothetical protein QQS21_006882 [Conoideocrella luteorostrata]
MQLTFLNVTDAPGLSPAEQKLVRGHVTKSNFERRRRTGKGGSNTTSDRHASDNPDDLQLTLSLSQNAPLSRRHRQRAELDGSASPSLVGLPAMTMTPSDPDGDIRYLLRQYSPLVFPTAVAASDAPLLVNWVALLRSEPALVEASMAIATRHRKTSDLVQSSSAIATLHTCRAVNMISERLGRVSTELTDGLLGAVFTLSYCELLVDNETARNAHITGLAQMVRLRKGQALRPIPRWITEFFFQDSVGAVIASPNDYSVRIAGALGVPNGKAYIQAISQVTAEFSKLSSLVDDFRLRLLPSQAQDISNLATSLENSIDIMPKVKSSHLQALEHALRLYLHILWPPPLSLDRKLHCLVDHLKQSLHEPKIRLCSAMNLTVWQLFVGTVAAGGHSEMREWFIWRLKRIFSAMGIYAWERLLVLFGKTFMPDRTLLMKFKRVWEEIRRSDLD